MIYSACKICNKRLLAAYRKTPKGKAKYQEYARRHRQKPSYVEKHKAYRNTPKAQWRLYIAGAKKRGLEFEFTLEEFVKSFWQKPCSYCGGQIATVGVDRVDNARGYTQGNTSPCCSTCNFMKLQSSREAFIAQCVRIAKHSALVTPAAGV